MKKKPITFELLKILPKPFASSNSIDYSDKTFYSNSISSSDCADGVIYLQSSVYEDVFGKKKPYKTREKSNYLL